MKPVGHLSALFDEIFQKGRLERFVADYFGFGDEINWDEPLASVTNQVAEYVEQHGLTAQFIDTMVEKVPAKADRIEQVRLLVAEANRSDDSVPDGIVPLAANYDAVQIDFGSAESGYQVWAAAEPTGSAGSVDDPERPDQDKPNQDKPAVDVRPLVLNADSSGSVELVGITRDVDGPTSDRLLPSDPAGLGRRLWDAVFGPDGAGLGAGLPKINPQTGGRRVILDLTDTPELARVPWELTQPPHGPAFGVDTKSPVVRKLDHDLYEPALLKVQRPPLKLLVATAQPPDRESLDVASELAEILKSGDIQVSAPLVDASFETLFEALESDRPDVLHFIGHGSAEGIHLAAPGTPGTLLRSEELATLARNNAGHLRLVFLNSCLGAKETNTSAFTSAAAKMVEQGLPAAIAMQYPISDGAAISLSEVFYRRLAHGEELDVALTWARSFLKGRGNAEWPAPALYMRNWEGSLALVDQPLSDADQEAVITAEVAPQAAPAAEVAPQPPPTMSPGPAAPQPAPSIGSPAAPSPAASAPIGSAPPPVEAASRFGRWGAGLAAAAAVVLALLAVGLFSSSDDSTDDVADGGVTTEITEPATTQTTEPGTDSTTTTTETDDSEDPEPEPAPPADVIAGPIDLDDAGINVQHGLPGEPVDIYIDGEAVAPGLDFGDSASAGVGVEPGTYEVQVFPAAENPPVSAADRDDQPVISQSVTVDDSAASIAVHPDAAGEPVVSEFEENLADLRPATGRITVRNLSEGPPLTVSVDGEPSAPALDSGASSDLVLSPGGHRISVAAADGSVEQAIDVQLADGELAVVSAIGSAADGLELVVTRYTGLSTAPVGVPTGNSGLRARVGRNVGPSTAALPSPTFGRAPLADGTANSAGAGTGPLTPAAGARPARISIGAISVEVPIVAVGVDPKDRLEVPEPDQVGWYEHGPAPGQHGSAVLAAHVDYNGQPGAFFNLREVLTGDTFEVTMDDGTVQRYVVVHNSYYDKTELPVDELFDKNGPSRLQLVTCGGGFDHDAGSYEGNVVVTAVPV